MALLNQSDSFKARFKCRSSHEPNALDNKAVFLDAIRFGQESINYAVLVGWDHEKIDV